MFKGNCSVRHLPQVFLHNNAKIRCPIGAKSHIYAICVHREAGNYEGTE